MKAVEVVKIENISFILTRRGGPIAATTKAASLKNINKSLIINVSDSLM